MGLGRASNPTSLVTVSLASQTLSVPQRRSLGVVERKGSGLLSSFCNNFCGALFTQRLSKIYSTSRWRYFGKHIARLLPLVWLPHAPAHGPLRTAPRSPSLVSRPNFSRAPCGLVEKDAGLGCRARAKNLVSGDETTIPQASKIWCLGMRLRSLSSY